MFHWQSIPEYELVPYGHVGAFPPDGLVVLAPHPDDEVFGCGGTVARACDAGCPVAIVIATDGGKGGNPVVREAESRRAAQVISGSGRVPDLAFWRHPDRELVPDSDLVAQIRAEVRARRPGWLLAPSPFEVHPDHRALCMAAIEAASELPVELGFFEIGQPLMPDRFVDITAVMPRKRAAMACFASQIDVQRYDEQVEATNRLRSYTLGPDVVYAEALWFPPAEARKGVKQVVDALARRLAWRMGVEPDPT